MAAKRTRAEAYVDLTLDNDGRTALPGQGTALTTPQSASGRGSGSAFARGHRLHDAATKRRLDYNAGPAEEKQAAHETVAAGEGEADREARHGKHRARSCGTPVEKKGGDAKKQKSSDPEPAEAKQVVRETVAAKVTPALIARINKNESGRKLTMTSPMTRAEAQALCEALEHNTSTNLLDLKACGVGNDFLALENCGVES